MKLKKLSLFLAVIITLSVILSGCTTLPDGEVDSDTLLTAESIGDTETESNRVEETFSETVTGGTDTEQTGPLNTEESQNTETKSPIDDAFDGAEANFFMINDNHGVFVSDGGAGGVERIADLLKKIESSKGDSIKIANGDIFQGTYVSSTLRGAPMIDALNEMEFDCFVIGNHEFDWGLDVIARYADGNKENGEANFPFLGANIYEKSTGKRVEWLEPYTIVENKDAKVGIIGVIGTGLENSILTSKVEDYVFVDYVELVADYSAELRSQGCELVVLAAHEYEENAIKDIAKLDGEEAIDAIFCAHTHQKINERIERADGKYISVVQNYGNGGTATFLELVRSCEGIDSQVFQYNIRDYNLNADMTENVIQKYAEIISESNSIIGYSNYSMSKDELGHIATDAMVKKYGADVGIINTGGVRATVDSGNVSAADIFSVFPFENAVVLVPMTGAQITNLYDRSGSYLYFNSDFNEYSLSLTETYTVAVIDYVYESNYYQYVFESTVPEYTPDVMRDVVIDAFKEDYSVNSVVSAGYYEYDAA